MDVKLPARWADEPARLAAVRQMHEFSAIVEPVLGNIVRIAAEAVSAPMAMLTLVEAERVRTLVRHNVGITQLRRSASPCARVVADRAPLQIPDLLEDPRYAVGPLTAVDPGARSYSGVPLFDATGNVIGALSVLDRTPGTLSTERAQLLGLLADQATAVLTLGATVNQSATRATSPDRFGADFVSLITHEVRTPVSVITGNLELLDELGDLPEPARQRMVSAIRRNADRLVRLIDHLLVTARADSAPTARTPTELNGLVTSSVRMSEAKAKQAGVALDLQLGQPLTVPADATMLRTAVDNLLSNALLFTPQGGRITVQVSNADAAPEAVRSPRRAAVVTITDTGVGIPADEVPLVFEQFFRGAHAQRVEAPGAGLGLTVAKAIAVAHHGGVHLESAPGRGTTVRLVLPLDPH